MSAKKIGKAKNPKCGTCFTELVIAYNKDGEARLVQCPGCLKVLFDREKFYGEQGLYKEGDE